MMEFNLFSFWYDRKIGGWVEIGGIETDDWQGSLLLVGWSGYWWFDFLYLDSLIRKVRPVK